MDPRNSCIHICLMNKASPGMRRTICSRSTTDRFAVAVYVVSCTLLCACRSVDSKARFLGHIPHEDDRQLAIDEDYNIHDSIVKLPGRHYPKLPYTIPYDQSLRTNARQSYLSRLYTPSRKINRTPAADGSNFPSNEPRVSPVRANLEQTNSPPDNCNQIGCERINGNLRHLHPGSQGYRMETDERSREPDTSGATDIQHSPRFDRTLSRNVTVQRGKTAALVCRVIGLRDKSVSWIRLKNLNILTISDFRYSTDMRVSVQRDVLTSAWTLRIANTSERDTGAYECQVSTKPILSFVVQLNIVEDAVLPGAEYATLQDAAAATAAVPEAAMLGPAEVFLHRGDVIRLTCEVTHPRNVPVTLDWYHLDRVLMSNVAAVRTYQRQIRASLNSNNNERNIVYDDEKSKIPTYQSHDNIIPEHNNNIYSSASTFQFNNEVNLHRQTESIPVNSKPTTMSVYHLTVGLATAARAGKYTCTPAGGKEGSVTVHVNTGVTGRGGDVVQGGPPAAAATLPVSTVILLTVVILPALLTAHHCCW